MIYSKNTFNAIFVFDISDAPYQDRPTKCLWHINQTEICRVTFHTNTKVAVNGLWKNGKTLEKNKYNSSLKIQTEKVQTKTNCKLININC